MRLLFLFADKSKKFAIKLHTLQQAMPVHESRKIIEKRETLNFRGDCNVFCGHIIKTNKTFPLEVFY